MTKDPTKILEEQIEKDVELLFVPAFCISNAKMFLKQWLQRSSKNKVVVLHSQVLDTSLMLKEDRAEDILLYEPLSVCFEEIAWHFVFIPSALYIPAEMDWEWATHFSSTLLRIHFFASQTEDFGAPVYRNIRATALSTKEHFSMEALSGALQDVPALICGAGQSLSSQIDAIRKMHPHAAVFAGGAALTALSNEGACYHVAAGVDPSPIYSRFLLSAGFHVPFFYQHRFDSDVLQRYGGPKIAAASSQGSWLEAWLVPPEKSIEGGWTVSTFLTALALHMGCNPIIFVGVDLDIAGSYASQLSCDDRDKKEKKEWRLAKEWIEEKIALNQEHTFIDASKASFTGAIKMNLDQWLKQNAERALDIQGMLMQALAKAKRSAADIDIAEAISEMEKSFVEVSSLLSQLLELFSRSHPLDPTRQGEYIVLEYELTEQLSFRALLTPLWQVWRIVFERLALSSLELKLHQLLFFQRVIQSYYPGGISP